MKSSKAVLIGGLIVLLMSPGLVYGAGWTTKRLTATSGDSGSPKIAVDGANVYAVWEDDTPGNDEIYFRKSTDGGVTWQAAKKLTSNAGGSASPAIAVDGANIYVVWEDATPGIAQLYFMKSEDAGDRWQAARALTKSKTAKAGKPALAVVGASVYVAWQEDDSAGGGTTRIAFMKSVNGGAGWQAPKTLSGNTGSADAGSPALAAAGSGVYVVWEEDTPGNDEIYFRRSTNGGVAWQEPVRLTTNAGASVTPAVAALGAAVYVAWSDAGPGNQEIYFRMSADQGAAWQPGLRLTNGAGRSETPALAVDDEGLQIAWSDDTPGNKEAFYRASTNGGFGWKESDRLTTNAGASCVPSLGLGGSKVFIVWQDATPGNNEIFLTQRKPAADPISITLPNASSVWTLGATEKIEWRIPGSAFGQAAGAASWADLRGIDVVKIDLYKGAAFKAPIVAETSAGAGAFSWTVPAGLPGGTDYWVRVSSPTDGKVYNDSPPFQITDGTLPDLIVYSLRHDPVGPTTLNTVTVTAVVKNIGSVQAGALTLRLRVGSVETNHAVSALAAGASATVNRTVGPLAAGSYPVAAQADSRGAVAESSESNNSGTDSFTVAALPDLVVDSLTHGPASPTTLSTITITAVIKNIGAAQAGASKLRLSANATDTEHSLPALAAGATATVTRTAGPYAAGYYPVTALADYVGAVTESNETNNSKTDSFTVTTPPDLIVQSLTYTPANPDMADKITATIVVKNQGGGHGWSLDFAHKVD